MNWADWAIVGILLFSALVSVTRGFLKEMMSLAIWLSAALVASIFHDQMAELLVSFIETPSLRMIAAWGILFVAVLIIGGVINFFLGKLVKATGLTGTDRFMGFLFGLLRGVIVVMVFLVLASQSLPVKEDLWWQQSTLIPEFMVYEEWFKSTGTAVLDYLKNLF